jgi:hypothetical protein
VVEDKWTRKVYRMLVRESNVVRGEVGGWCGGKGEVVLVEGLVVVKCRRRHKYLFYSGQV